MKQRHIIGTLIILVLLSLLYLPGCSDDSLTFQVRFPESEGLKQGGRVYFGRNEIGQVKMITYTDQGDYLVEVHIVPEFKNAATEHSRFYIGHPPGSKSAMAVIVEQDATGGMVLSNGTTVHGSSKDGYFDNFFTDLQKRAGEAENELNEAINDLKKSLDTTSKKLDRHLKSAIEDLSLQLDSFADEIEKIPDSQEVQQIEDRFRQLADEFLKAQKDVQDYIRNELLPQFRQELESLREQLKKEGRENELKEIDKHFKKMEMV